MQNMVMYRLWKYTRQLHYNSKNVCIRAYMYILPPRKKTLDRTLVTCTWWETELYWALAHVYSGPMQVCPHHVVAKHIRGSMCGFDVKACLIHVYIYTCISYTPLQLSTILS